MNELTVAQQMAVAVLKGDLTAAYVLADKLLEQASETQESRTAKEAASALSRPIDGYEVYHWPEFQAFCRRAGIMYDLRTIDITLKIAGGSVFVVEQRYQAGDVPPQNQALDTTTLQNQGWRTAIPPDPNRRATREDR